MSRSLATGVVLNGYRIERVLSDDGSFAVVYLAYDTDADRVARRRDRIAGRLGRWGNRYGPAAAAAQIDPGPLVALKEYIPKQYGVRRGEVVAAQQGLGDVFAWGRERFVRESKFLEEHSHPNVVAVYDVFSANNTEYYVMERLEGGSLADKIKAGGVQAQAQVLKWLLPVLEGLASVERRDSDHLDLSPDNIMFRKSGDPVLVDFGASRIGGSPPIHSSRLVVNDNFAPPEKYTETSSKLSAPSDIYSLSAIVLYALSGETPAEAPERQAGKPAFSETAQGRLHRQAGDALLQVVQKGFSIGRHDRYSDARVFSDAVVAAAGRGNPTPKTRPGPSGGGGGASSLFGSSNVALPLLIAAAVLIVLGLIILRLL